MSENWWERPFVSFDLETTGVQPETARIVTASIVRIDPQTGETRPAEWLVDPLIEIPAEATTVHGITTEQARADGMDPQNAVDQISQILMDTWYDMRPVVIYNAPYDLTVLDREMRRHLGFGFGEDDMGPVVDPLVIDKAMDTFRRGSRKLVDTVKHYGIELSEQDAHGSTADALATARLAWKLPRVHTTIAEMRLPELHAAQIGWRAEQAASLEKYLRRKDPDVVVDRDWPIKPMARTVVAS